MKDNQAVSTGIRFSAEQALEQLNAVNEALSKIATQIDKVIVNTTKASTKTKIVTQDINKSLKNMNFQSVTSSLKNIYSTIKKLSEPAIDYIEDLNLLKVAFGDTADSARNMIDEIADITGFDTSTLTRMTATFRQLTETLYLGSEYSDLLSTNLTKMALDVSSLYNIDLDTAASALQGAFTGQPRSIKAYTGANVTDEALQQELTARGIDRKTSSLNQGEKAIVTYLALERQLANSNGDLASTIEQPASQLRIFSEQIKRAAKNIGNLFIPVLQKVLPYLNAFLMVFSEIVEYIMGILGIDTESFWESMSSGANNLKVNLDSVGDSAKSAMAGLRGFDKLNVIKTPTETDTSGLGGLNIDSAILDQFKEYDAQLDKIKNKAAEIRDSIMEWLGFTKDINGEWEFSEIKLGTIVGILLGMGGTYLAINKVFKVVSGLGKILTGGKIAAGAATTAKATSGLSTAFSGLASSLGLSTGGLAAILVALAALGVGIAYLNVSPAIKQINVLEGASDKTQKALSGIITQFDDLSKDVKQADWTDQIITQSDIKNTKRKLNTLTSTIKTKLDEQKTDALSIYNETLEKTLGKKTVADMKKKTENYYNTQKTVIDDYKNQILKIEQNAAKENRALTEEEVDDINELYEKMKTNTVTSLSESKNEADWILWEMKENAKALTAEQASEIIKNSIKTRDEAIQAAKDQYEKTVYEAHKLKEAGAISEEEYNKIKSAATTTRDEAIQAAKDQHQKVYDEFKSENEEIAKYIDEDTGGVKSKWQKMWSDLTDTSTTWKQKLKTIWNDLFNNTGEAKVGIKDNKGKKTSTILESQIFTSKGGSFASGGFPDTGQMFVAREAGPELVGRIGNKTAVANNDQIVQAVAQGVASAITSSGGLGGNKVVIEATGDSSGLMNFITFKQKEQNKQFGL